MLKMILVHSVFDTHTFFFFFYRDPIPNSLYANEDETGKCVLVIVIV